MKIKTITCHHVYNHGALLQAYALIEFLKGEGHEASIIDYRPQYLDGHFKLWRSDSRHNRIGLGWAYVLAKLPGRICALKRKKAFDTFFDHYMSVTERVYHSIDELRDNPPEADLYIAGSDQIWNTDFKNGNDASFYLSFGNCHKISYAASFATSKLHDGTEDFVKKELKNFDAISVRENSGKIILNQLGFNGEVVVDPVFLITKERWDKIATEYCRDMEYVLVYDFENNEDIQKLAQRYARLNHCKIFSIGPYHMDYPDKCFLNYGPDTFVGLIRNAQCVFSNSFHASAFSLIYNTPFFIVNRKDGLNNRMSDLLKHYNLIERLVSSDCKDETLVSIPEWNSVSQIIEYDITMSKQWLKKSIIR